MIGYGSDRLNARGVSRGSGRGLIFVGRSSHVYCRTLGTNCGDRFECTACRLYKYSSLLFEPRPPILKQLARAFDFAPIVADDLKVSQYALLKSSKTQLLLREIEGKSGRLVDAERLQVDVNNMVPAQKSSVVVFNEIAVFVPKKRGTCSPRATGNFGTTNRSCSRAYCRDPLGTRSCLRGLAPILKKTGRFAIGKCLQ